MGTQYGILDYTRYDPTFYSELVTRNVVNFMDLIIVRLSPGNEWPYAKKRISAQIPTQGDPPAVSFDIFNNYASPSLPDDYLATLLGVMKEQNAAHRLRDLDSYVGHYPPYDGGQVTQAGGYTLVDLSVTKSSPIFLAAEDLIQQSIFLEVEQVSPDTFPEADMQRYREFLNRTLTQLKTLPPQVPFMGRTGEDTPDSEGYRAIYNLQRIQTEPQASRFSYSLAVSVTAAFLSFIQNFPMASLSFMSFRVVQIVNMESAVSIGLGSFGRVGPQASGGQTASPPAFDTA